MEETLIRDNESNKATRLTELFEIAKLYCDRGDFLLAIEKFQQVTQLAYEEMNFTIYLFATNLLLRLYAEREQFEDINQTKERLQDLVLKEGLELNAKTYYTLALCASFKGQDETSLDYLHKSLALALAKDNKEDICYAICGTALVYAGLKKYNEALKEIYNLQIFFQVLNISEIKISTLILNAGILIELNKPEQAIDILWQTLDLVRETKTMTMHIYTLYNLGRAYLKANDKDLARLYFNLAYRMIEPQNFVHLEKAIRKEMEILGDNQLSNYDLIFNIEKNFVVERKLGSINFKNQFILLDLLKLFIQNQGKVYSKEYLVEQVWKQEYDPAVHDNKIYVTIKRLRKMIEPDFDKPKYIFRAKNGYYMNRSAKVLIEQKGGEQ